jgi:hypothetical protein
MGLYGYGVVFYGWHFRLDVLKEKFPKIRDKKWFDNYTFDVKTSSGKIIQMNIEEKFMDQWYEEAIFGKIYLTCETFRIFRIEKVPFPTEAEMTEVKEVFEDYELGVSPKFLLTGLGYC